ncbi:MAG: phosphoenolpyruvate--protein phosphotransferase [Chloroflexi bacterium]|nr:MAG: phosphoenolpyruvate--protein phosphotransferase [Chloroflexota bacterium]TMF19790.1 MAG: phosphoenolpyruvate--protein phosphotransferase [Chloroflexota bacterium]TMF96978.1 MAG: phosphoenolpyruvate--protein phosphotransferase [Chloroflexota bacterium]
MVGIVLVSHSFELAHGLAALTSQLAGDEVRVEPAGGGPNGTLGTTDDTVRAAIARADRGQGVVVLADLGSSVLTVRHLLEEGHGNGHVRLVDAPFVEGAIAAAVTSSAGQDLEDVVHAAEEARGARKF